MPTKEQEERWNKILVRGRIPKHYHAVPMVTVLKQIGEPARTELLEYLAEFGDHRRSGRGLYLHGKPQTGKATAAAFVLRRAITLDTMVLYVEAEEARIGFVGRELFDPEQTLADRMKTVDLLCIAHLGTERPTDDFTAAFSMLLRTRTGSSRPTIITSYLDPQDMKKRYGMHTASALERACTIVHVTPEDDL
jgi:DNA replication protein DnaC